MSRGAIKRNVVPRPGALSMSNRPPSSVRRSRMLNSPHPTWLSFRPFVELRRVEAESLVLHGDAKHVIRAQREIDRDAIDMGVLDHVEEELPDGFEEQRAYVFSVGIGARVGRDLTSSPYLLRDQSASQAIAVGNPDVCSTGGNSSTLSDRAAVIASSR